MNKVYVISQYSNSTLEYYGKGIAVFSSLEKAEKYIQKFQREKFIVQELPLDPADSKLQIDQEDREFQELDSYD